MKVDINGTKYDIDHIYESPLSIRFLPIESVPSEISGNVFVYNDNDELIKVLNPNEYKEYFHVGVILEFTNESFYEDKEILENSISVAITKSSKASSIAKKAISTSTTLLDDEALEVPDMFYTWDEVLENAVIIPKDRIISKDGKLYRVRQDVLPLEHQPPDGEGMGAIYAIINKTNEGTPDDPIPAEIGMEYIYGKYYLDPEDSNIYLCTRIGASEGETIVLQYLPHQLIGQYFELYTA